MTTYKVVSYRNFNSDGRTKTAESEVKASNLRWAKWQASNKFPTKGRWVQCQSWDGSKYVPIDEYVKTTSGNMIGSDILCLIPIS